MINTYNEVGQSTRTNKKNISANKEWVNSVYSFNNNTIRFLPAVHSYVFKLLRAYFNLLNEKLKKKLTSKKARKVHHLSSSKIWISTPEIKHLSERLYITIYVYNRIYNIYKRKLELLEFNQGAIIDLSDDKKIVNKPKKKVYIKNVNNLSTNSIQLLKNKLLKNFHFLWKTEFIDVVKDDINLIRKNKIDIANKGPVDFQVTRKIKALRRLYPTYIGKAVITKWKYLKLIKWLKLDKLGIINQYKCKFLNLLGDKKEWTKQLENLKLERYNYLINLFAKELGYLKLKQNMLFNQFKFSEIYLTPLINFLQTIYKKKVVVNIIAIKYYYLNTSILSQIIVKNLKKEKFRGRYLTVVDRARLSIRIPVLGSSKFPRIEKKFTGMQNLILDNFKMKDKNKDYLEQFLLTKKALSDKYIHKSVVKNLENKVIGGMFIKTSGRLTKRYRADRAISTLRRKGTLQNVYSAHKGFSSNLSRGYSNINIEKTMIHSRTRVGAYGLTGWIASY